MSLVRRMLQKLAPAQPALTTIPAPTPVFPAPAAIRELHMSRQLITVTLPSDPTSYQSLILAIDAQRGLLWVDDLFPTQAHLRAGDTLEITHHRNGELLTFRSAVVALGRHCGIDGLALSLPKAVHYRPRRRWPRLTLGQPSPVSVILSLPESGPLYGKVLDVSAGGVRVTIPGDWRAQLRPGDQLPLCQFTLAPGLMVRCRARVCAYQSHPLPWRQTHISLAFTDLPRERSEDIQRFVLSSTRGHTYTNPDIRAA